jgi:hypothetical protein
MPPPRNDDGPRAAQRESRSNAEIAATATDRVSVQRGADIRRAPDPARELEAWLQAVEHLHALNLPAPVPEFPAAWLRRRGVYPDWTAAA